MTDPAEGTQAILSFLFNEIGVERWWERSTATDTACVDRFADLWTEWRSRMPESFLGSAREALAGVILFDQYPRNMFRDHADAYSTDSLALAIAKGAVDRRLDDVLTEEERSFLYMPFQHSELLADQDRSVALFTALGDVRSLDFAKKHHDMIARFGRFPVRNEVLGRAERPGERPAIEMSRDW